MKGLRLRRRRAAPASPLERALASALVDGRWQVPDRFNFTGDVVEPLAENPKRVAVTCLSRDGVIEPRTFLQLAEGASRWAAYLRDEGARPGDSVLILLGTSHDWLEVLLACLKAGLIAVPCAPGVLPGELERWIAASGASLLVSDRGAERLLGELSLRPAVRYLDELPPVRRGHTLERAPTHATAARDVALVVPTAGTEGDPRPVAHTHGATFACRVQAERWLDASPGDVVWCTGASSSLEALWNGVFGPLARGAETVFHDGAFDPEERLDHLRRLGVTVLCQAPAEYRALAELPERELRRLRPPHLRRLVSTGDALDPETAAVFAEAWGLTIHEGYGQAETGIVLANGADAGFRPGSLGLPLPGHHVAVVDEQGSELPPGLEGNLAVRGRPPTLFAGYWERPEETREAFSGDWYLTGDLARRDEDGFFWFVARSADLVVSRGRSFGPHEVERVLETHPAVRESGVVGIRDLERGGHFVRAFVVPPAGVEGSEQLEIELREHVEAALPAQQVPREIEFVDELPRTGSGKLRRAELRERPVARRPLWDLGHTEPSPVTDAPLVPAPPPP
ncbi:MAG TPA: AMP-binding protein, partial [Gaiellaceae bacterium]|nr:AMP-binding protein [Gaiellaceae bacterium]